MYNMSVWVGDDILSFLLSKFDVLTRWTGDKKRLEIWANEF